jgi:hypothetical protein
MQRSTRDLPDLLLALSRRARDLGWTDTAWCTRAGVRKETLSRLRSRGTCDFGTLESLARAVGSRLQVRELKLPDTTADGHFPAAVGRDHEERLADLCASGRLDDGAWASLGPRFFMAGLAVLAASDPQLDRAGLLALAERLHPGAGEPAVFARWLRSSPVRPTRFFATLNAAGRRAA